MKNKYLSILFLVLLFSNHCFSQQEVKIKKKEFEISENGFRAAWKEVRKANQLFKKGQPWYREAREKYLKAAQYNNKNAQLNYQIGVCYLFTDNKGLATEYFQNALKADPEVAFDIHYLIALSHQMKGEYESAINEYNITKTTLSKRKIKKINDNIDLRIEECQNAINLENNKKRVIISNPGPNINSVYDDYYPIITVDQKEMYFNSRRPLEEYSSRALFDNKYTEDVYKAVLSKDQWEKSSPVLEFCSDNRNEAVVGISPDKKTLYIYNSLKGKGDIYYSKYNEKRKYWGKPKKVKKINSKYRETSFFITSDGNSIYFISERERGSFGGKDIFYSTQKDGKWTKPLNIGFPINSLYNEESPFLSSDGKTLYFSSKGHQSIGGYDIFVSQKNENGKWSKPENIGIPINTPDNDLHFRMLNNDKEAYYTTNREGSLGETDIFKVTFLGSEKEMITLSDRAPNFLMSKFKFNLLDIPVEAFFIDTTIYLTGKVLDIKTQKPVLSKIEFIDSQKSQVVATIVTDTSGQYKVSFPQKLAYGVQVVAKDYILYLDILDLNKFEGNKINKDFLLSKLEVGTKVVMKNIFFPKGKISLLPESYAELGKVLIFLQDNPTIQLEISGHTDNIGKVAINKKLSEGRAKSVVDYLVSQGIDPQRLVYKGYGSTQPVASNKTETDRAQNRRVEFKILGK